MVGPWSMIDLALPSTQSSGYHTGTSSAPGSDSTQCCHCTSQRWGLGRRRRAVLDAVRYYREAHRSSGSSRCSIVIIDEDLASWLWAQSRGGDGKRRKKRRDRHPRSAEGATHLSEHRMRGYVWGASPHSRCALSVSTYEEGVCGMHCRSNSQESRQRKLFRYICAATSRSWLHLGRAMILGVTEDEFCGDDNVLRGFGVTRTIREKRVTLSL
jgi:hypothetical protein